MTDASAPNTIVLVHGFWVTPRSWENFIAHYEAPGYRVIAPAYPGFEVEVETLNRDTTPIEQVTVPKIIDRFERVLRELDTPPILIGTRPAAHSFRFCSITDMARAVWP